MGKITYAAFASEDTPSQFVFSEGSLWNRQ